MKELLKPKIKFRGEHYRNEKLAAWVKANFATPEAQDAAWQTIKFIREEWPDAGLILRGHLIGIDEGEA